MFVAIFFGFFIGSMTQMQIKYDHCKENKFTGEYCKTQKRLYESNSK